MQTLNQQKAHASASLTPTVKRTGKHICETCKRPHLGIAICKYCKDTYAILRKDQTTCGNLECLQAHQSYRNDEYINRLRNKPIVKICQLKACGKQFWGERNTRKYCSNRCSGLSRGRAASGEFVEV